MSEDLQLRAASDAFYSRHAITRILVKLKAKGIFDDEDIRDVVEGAGRDVLAIISSDEPERLVDEP